MTVAVEILWFINISSTFLKVILYTTICRIAGDLTSVYLIRHTQLDDSRILCHPYKCQLKRSGNENYLPRQTKVHQKVVPAKFE